jgi:hypothetical protein
MMARLKLWVFALGVGVLVMLASWSGGRRSAQTDSKVRRLEDDLATSLRAKEIENEVEALSPDTLQSRSRKWVRKTGE